MFNMTAVPEDIEGWSLGKTLGSGGFGIVKLWTHRSGKKVAIKTCKWDISQLTETQQNRWINELQTMKRLKHHNIVKALELPFRHPDDTINLPVLCMEFCRKGDLRKVLNKVENCCGLNEKEAIRVMWDVSSAIKYLHYNNITHRDLKPENIVLQDEHGTISYKLIDLGYAKDLGEASTSASIVGTLNYIAPEILWKQKYSCSVDYWSLGILFYELVTGVRPFLPRMRHTMTWMQHIKNKHYNDICAFELDENIIFGQDIQDPTNLSECFRNKLVEWFRVVLQWDPKKRGKQYDENGVMQPVVFEMLHSILSKQIIYVFSASLYKIYAYRVDSTTKILDLQCMIKKDTNIPISLQTVTDYFGNVLVANETPLLSRIEEPVLFVFKDVTTLRENTPAPNIPTTLQTMIELSRNQLEFETLIEYYRVAIFFIKREIYLFQLYIFALTIRVDFVITRLKALSGNIKDALVIVNTLSNELSTIFAKCEKEPLNVDKAKAEALEMNFKRVTELAKSSDQLRLKLNALIQESNEVKNIAENIDCIKYLSQIYDKAVKLFELCRNNHKSATPTQMVKLIFEFLKVQESQFHNENIIEIIKQTRKLEVELRSSKIVFDAAVIMTATYHAEFQNITQSVFKLTSVASNKEQPLNTPVHVHTDIIKMLKNNDSMGTSCELHSNQPSNTSVEKCSETTNTDNMIYDNLVIRHTLDNLLLEIQKKFMDIGSLEP